MLYDVLSPNFIFVDGTPNKDGTVITEKMDYVPYSNGYYEEHYDKLNLLTLFKNDNRVAKGSSRIHKLYEDKKNIINSDLTYRNYNNMMLNLILCVSKDLNASGCFYKFFMGNGGRYDGCVIDEVIGSKGGENILTLLIFLTTIDFRETPCMKIMRLICKV